jgi:aminoglycoside/choline kinase family phosphotransferase
MSFWTAKFMPDRVEEIDTFLAGTDWQNARRIDLANDASPRRYQRLLRDDGREAILMDAPPAAMDISPFLIIARHLKHLGFSTPEIYKDDQKIGLALIEDFGDQSFNQILRTEPEREQELYGLAVDILSSLHQLPADQAIASQTPDYSAEILLEEVSRFILWYMPAENGVPLQTGCADEFQHLWSEAIKPVFDQPKTHVFRDFHIDNLMVLGDRSGVKRCGLLDFQDAVVGAGAYDLVSLLEDARRDVGDELTKTMYNRYVIAMGMSDQQQTRFATAYAILGAQRHTKILGLFVRLCVRDAKPVYLKHLPRVWRLLERNLCHPALSSLKTWFDTNLPEDKRGIPPHLAEHIE